MYVRVRTARKFDAAKLCVCMWYYVHVRTVSSDLIVFSLNTRHHHPTPTHTARILRSSPQFGVTLVTYELIQRLFYVDFGHRYVY